MDGGEEGVWILLWEGMGGWKGKVVVGFGG